MEDAINPEAQAASSVVCELCDKVCRNAHGLKVHMGRIHKDRLQPNTVAIEAQNHRIPRAAEVPEEISNPYSCRDCDRRFKTMSALLKHCSIHIDRRNSVDASRASKIKEDLYWSESVRTTREAAEHVERDPPASVQFLSKLPPRCAVDNPALDALLSDENIEAEILKARTAPSKEVFLESVEKFMSAFHTAASSSADALNNAAKDDAPRDQNRQKDPPKKKKEKKLHLFDILGFEIKTINKLR